MCILRSLNKAPTPRIPYPRPNKATKPTNTLPKTTASIMPVLENTADMILVVDAIFHILFEPPMEENANNPPEQQTQKLSHTIKINYSFVHHMSNIYLLRIHVARKIGNKVPHIVIRLVNNAPATSIVILSSLTE